MKVLSIQIGQPKIVHHNDREVQTSFFKEPISGSLNVGKLGIAGDTQSDLKVHGGAFKAVYAYPSEHFNYWRKLTPQHAFENGVFGENLTTTGLIETEVSIGDVYQIGSATLRISQPRFPCFKLGIKFGDSEMIRHFHESLKSGIYFEVLEEGSFQSGDDIQTLSKNGGATIHDFVVAKNSNGQEVDLIKKLIANTENNQETQNTPTEAREEKPVDKSTYLSNPVLKESLFFFLRNMVVRITENTFIQFEDIKITGKQFMYTIVESDRGLMKLEASNQSNQLIHFASYTNYQNFTNSEMADTVTVTGFLDVIEISDTQIEGSPSVLKINVNGEVELSFMTASPYGYGGYERNYDGYDINQELVVKLNEPKIYNRNELYLKARIQLLSKEELSNFSKDELAYLRNELFARHGHRFKTEKMEQYFSDKSWYQPYFYDATLFLNETEKENALFIKSLEG